MGLSNTPTNDIADHLLRIGSLHGHTALTVEPSRATERELLDLAYHAGACVELVSKSILARSHPFLLRDQKIWGQGKPLASTLAGWRTEHTLSAGNALSAACEILGVRLRASAADILKDRNAAVHFGLQPASPTALIRKLALWLYDLQSLDVAFDDAVTGELTASLDHRRAWTAEKFTIARAVVVSPPSADNQAWANEPDRHADLDEQVECPACGNAAVVYTFIGPEVEYAGGGEYTTYAVADLFLRCPFCRLELDDFDLQSLPDPLKPIPAAAC